MLSQIWNGFAQINVQTINYYDNFSIAVICFKGSEEVALYQRYDQIAPKSSNRAFKYFCPLSLIRIGKVLIHDKSM